jgi:hypothetical protein
MFRIRPISLTHEHSYLPESFLDFLNLGLDASRRIPAFALPLFHFLRFTFASDLVVRPSFMHCM